MKVSLKIEKRLQEIQAGTVFKYQDLDIDPTEYAAASKKMERLTRKGTLKKVSTGLFYKPKTSVFGILQPQEDELLKQRLFKKGQRVAYVTGVSWYNTIGLTTQVPTVIKIAKTKRSSALSVGHLTIKPTKSYVEITNENYELLGLLDAIKDFNKIPDMDGEFVIHALIYKLQAMGFLKRNALIEYALKYPPKVRALLGALLSNTDPNLELSLLKKSLNPLTKYKYGIPKMVLGNASKWNLL